MIQILYIVAYYNSLGITNIHRIGNDNQLEDMYIYILNYFYISEEQDLLN